MERREKAKEEYYRFMFPVDLEPPKRVSGIPDDGIVSCVTAVGCLRSPPISSIIADVKNAKSSQAQQHRCPPKGNGPPPGPATSSSYDDLIHLPRPLNEDAVLKCLQARFCAKQYHVSNSLLIILIQYTQGRLYHIGKIGNRLGRKNLGGGKVGVKF